MAALAEGPITEVEVEPFTLKGAGGVLVPAMHARPAGMPRAGLVLHPDLMGLRPLFDDLGRRLATHGFAVCAIEPFARLLAAGTPGLDDPARRMAQADALDDELQLGDLARAADHLVVTDDVTEVAILGFCMGGMYTLKAASTGRFDRAVAFYGMLRVPEGWRGPGQRDALEMLRDGSCPTLALFGDRDPWVPDVDVDALRDLWRGETDHEIVVYPGADHGFVHDPDRPAHRDDDAADAWKRALAFLGA